MVVSIIFPHAPKKTPEEAHYHIHSYSLIIVNKRCRTKELETEFPKHTSSAGSPARHGETPRVSLCHELGDGCVNVAPPLGVHEGQIWSCQIREIRDKTSHGTMKHTRFWQETSLDHWIHFCWTFRFFRNGQGIGNLLPCNIDLAFVSRDTLLNQIWSSIRVAASMSIIFFGNPTININRPTTWR
jgi:hypothetical protein